MRNVEKPKSKLLEKHPPWSPRQREEDDKLELDNEEEEKQSNGKSHTNGAQVEFVDQTQADKPKTHKQR